jgi:6-pyruvoyltetrahydropterin/6-carboxytetrahydropterin synthase
MREVRFSLVPPEWSGEKITNSWAGWPGAAVVAPYLVLEVVVSGEPHPVTGYLVNISIIDRIVREQGIPTVWEHYQDGEGPPPVPRILQSVWRAIQPRIPQDVNLDALHLNTTPYLRFTALPGEPPMIRMTQSFEFSASHRLHCKELSDEENRKTFGKCNNPAGHGHNYVLEVTIEGEPDPATGALLALGRFEGTVKQRVIDRLDHQHLNECREFASLNPSAENIARVIWDLLVGAFDSAGLHAVRVWETPKTYAEYAGR